MSIRLKEELSSINAATSNIEDRLDDIRDYVQKARVKLDRLEDLLKTGKPVELDDLPPIRALLDDCLSDLE